MLDINALKTFIIIAETANFNKTATIVGRTQSAVSQQILKLEHTLNKKLILREKSNLLTSQGEILLGYAKKILSLHNEAIDRFKEPDTEGEINIGVPEHFASVYLPEILAEFSLSHPKILIKVECDLTLKLLSKFRAGEFDLVLLKMSQPEDLPNGVEVWKQKLVWVGKHHVDYNLDTLPLVLSPQPCVLRARALEALENKARKWRLVYTSPSFSGTVAAVKAGLGITVLPKNTIPEGLIQLSSLNLPDLVDAHLSLITSPKSIKSVNILGEYITQKLQIRG